MVDVPQGGAGGGGVGGKTRFVCRKDLPGSHMGKGSAGMPVRRQPRCAVICARLTEWLWPRGSFQNNQAADARPWQRWRSEGGGGV